MSPVPRWPVAGDMSGDAENPEERGEVGAVVIVVRTRNVQIFKRYILSCRNCPADGKHSVSPVTMLTAEVGTLHCH